MTALFQNYGRRPLEIVEGKGTVVKDSNGKSYLDFTSGIAVVSLGHANERLVHVLNEQSKKMWHTSNLFESSGQEQLAQQLTNDTHLSRALFCNSGAEANEAMMKLARKHTGKSTIITFEQSFHGRTFGTMAATGQDKVKEGFGSMLESFITVPYNDPEALRQAMSHDVAAIMLEVIQGEGGVTKVTDEFAETIVEMSKTYGALILVDEVQTGIGRTGTRYAYEQTVIEPDIISLAKGLGGGFPVGAIVAKEKFAKDFGPGTHGTTFGGNPLAMAVANEVIATIFDASFLQEVEKKGAHLKEAIQRELPADVQVRGEGLLIGIKKEGWKAQDALVAAEEKGLLTVAAGNEVLRLVPPLTVTNEEIDEAVSILKDVLQTM